MNEVLHNQTLGVLVVQVSYLIAYGWLMAFIMPDKIAGLMRTTAIMGSIQYVAEYAYGSILY